MVRKHDEQQKKNAVEINALQRSSKTSRLERVNNGIIREKMRRTRIIKETESAQLKWYGSVHMMDGVRLPLKILNWMAQKKKRRG